MAEQNYCTRDWTYKIDERQVAEVKALPDVAVVEVEVVFAATVSLVEESLPVADDGVATPANATEEEAALAFPAIVAEAALAVAAVGVGDIAAAAAADVTQQQFDWFYRSPNQDCCSLAVEGRCCFEQQLIWLASNMGCLGQHNSSQLGQAMLEQDFVVDHNPALIE